MTLLHKGLSYSQRTARLLFCHCIRCTVSVCVCVCLRPAWLASLAKHLLNSSVTNVDGHVAIIAVVH